MNLQYETSSIYFNYLLIHLYVKIEKNITTAVYHIPHTMLLFFIHC
jgi:hypothetical protein